jgi:acetyltransferase-like isoleucine patch superfamily enzyme
MSDLKTRVYLRALGRDVRLAGPIDLSWPDLIADLWRRGGMARLRGAWRGLRLGTCGGRLFVGPRVRLWFPRHLHVGRNVFIGADSFINGFSRDGVRFGNDVRIREFAWIQATSTIDQPGVGLTIGDGTYVGPRCAFGAGGGLTIGRRVTFGTGVHLLAENHEFRDPSRLIQDQGVTRRGITVGDDVWMGNNVIVLDGVRIGRGAVIGAGAVVTRDVPDLAVAVGNPARVVGARGGPAETAPPA